MAEYKYIATTKNGTRVSDSIVAESEEDVELQLSRDGMQVVNIKLIPEAKETFLDKIFNKVSNADKAQFLEYFASMLEAGLTISDVLQAFYEDLDKPLLRKFIRDTQYNIRNGKRLSECFAAYPQLFPQMYEGMIKVGEASGTLAESLTTLALQLKKQNEIVGKVRNAMIYPTILVVALTSVVIVLIVFVFPEIQKFFKDAHLELPPITLFMLSLSYFIRTYWYLIIGTIAGGVTIYRQAMKNSKFRRKQSDLILRAPIIGPIQRNMNVALFARTLGSLLSSGVNILESMDVVYDSLSSQTYKEIVKKLKADVEVGIPLADSMKNFSQYFSPFEIRVISISERTGETAKGLKNIAEFYENKLFALLGGISSAIEPVILIFMGGMVVMVALSVITPLYQLLANVQDL